MKKHNTLFVVIFTVLFMVLLTWVLPITYLSGEFVSEARSQAGIVNLFTYPTYLIYNFVYVFIYILVVGGFYSVLNKTKAYRQLLDKIVNIVKGRKVLFLVLTVLLLSTIVSFTGHTFEAIIIFPFIIGIVLLLGYDKITASLMTLGPVVAGIMGSTFSKLVNGTFKDILNADSEIVKFTDLIWFKVLLLVLSSIIVIVTVILHAKKVTLVKKTEESIFIPEAVKKSDEVKKWPLITILSIMAVLFITGTINWSGAFKITFFTEVLEKFESLTLFGYPVFSRIVGSLVAFGEWSYNEYMVLIFVVMILFKLIYRVKFEELLDSIFDGIKNYLYAAGIMLISYSVLIITSNHPVMLTVLKPLMELTDGFNSVTLSIGTFVSALFSTDLTYHQYSILPLTYVTTFINDTTVYALCSLITQAIYGIAMLVAPTSIVLLFNLSSLKIGYFEWLKNIWKMLIALILIAFVVFTIILLII